jgi:hypothetical protein
VVGGGGVVVVVVAEEVRVESGWQGGVQGGRCWQRATYERCWQCCGVSWRETRERKHLRVGPGHLLQSSSTSTTQVLAKGALGEAFPSSSSFFTETHAKRLSHWSHTLQTIMRRDSLPVRNNAHLIHAPPFLQLPPRHQCSGSHVEAAYISCA